MRHRRADLDRKRVDNAARAHRLLIAEHRAGRIDNQTYALLMSAVEAELTALAQR